MNDLENYGKDLSANALGFWDGLHPGVRSGLIFTVFYVIVALINAFSAGTSIVFCYPVQLVLYVVNGALAGYFASSSEEHSGELAQVGAIAGLSAWVLPAIAYFILGLFFGFATFGIGLISLLGCLICGPVDLAIQALLGALGAWAYGHFGGARG